MKLYNIIDGVPEFSGKFIESATILDNKLREIGQKIGAEELYAQELVKVDTLIQYDYFENFPHLAGLISSIAKEKITKLKEVNGIKTAFLTAPEYCIPSSTCYRVYSRFAKQIINEVKIVSISGKCYRNEDAYNGLERLRYFTMREIVFIGNPILIKEKIIECESMIFDLLNELNIPFKVKKGVDPFFDKLSSRAKTQAIFPLKRELLFNEIAISSINYHRNFFGERTNIKMIDNSFAHSGCIGFGIERWLLALLDVHKNINNINKKLRKTSQL